MGDRENNEVQTFTGTNTAVGSSLEVVGPIVFLHGQKSRLSVQLENTGAALTDFQIQIVPDEVAYDAGQWHNLIQGAADWGSSTISIKPYADVTVGADMSVLGDAGLGAFEIIVPGMHAVRFRASCATTTSLVVHGQLVRLAA